MTVAVGSLSLAAKNDMRKGTRFIELIAFKALFDVSLINIRSGRTWTPLWECSRKTPEYRDYIFCKFECHSFRVFGKRFWRDEKLRQSRGYLAKPATSWRTNRRSIEISPWAQTHSRVLVCFCCTSQRIYRIRRRCTDSCVRADQIVGMGIWLAGSPQSTGCFDTNLFFAVG